MATHLKDGPFPPPAAAQTATLEELQQWTSVIGRAQQLLLEHATEALLNVSAAGSALNLPKVEANLLSGGETAFQAQADFWMEGIRLWQAMLTPIGSSATPSPPSLANKDRRFLAEAWHANPIFDSIRQGYLILCEHLLKNVDAIEGVDARQREQLRFLTRVFTDALSPSNFAFTNPEVIDRTLRTKGENLLVGLSRLLTDISSGQLTHTDRNAFRIGENIAATPGKVIHETPLYQLIHYTPTTPSVDAIPLVIFPPWINRFYILDLNPGNSFVKWAVEQGLSVFMVSWKSADATMADVSMDDYVLNGMVDAIDTVRDLLGTTSVHTIGYCVAGTALSMALAWLAAKDQADKVASATFFTAQVDFSGAGDLGLLVDDQQLRLIDSLSAETGYLDGRFMAATFNLLRGRDLIWNYVVSNYLLGEEYKAFDLLYWNGDTTNLPAKWHLAYLQDLYRDNKLVEPGALRIGDTPIDLKRVKTPSYVQAGREDHIAPAASVWKITEEFIGPVQFVLAGSGHVAGVVNPPAAGKYQYWTSDREARSLEAFIETARETKGSWWPHWRNWITGISDVTVPAKGARIPGKGKLRTIEDAPGRYVRTP